MSSKEIIQITCQECLNEQDVIIWKSVNIQITPEAKEDVLSGDLNLFKCESCNYQERIEISFLYHDMEREFLAMYYPLVKLHELNVMANFDSHGKPTFGEGKRDSGEKYNYADDIHLVFDIGELSRYISFREKLFETRKKFDASDGIIYLLP